MRRSIRIVFRFGNNHDFVILTNQRYPDSKRNFQETYDNIDSGV